MRMAARTAQAATKAEVREEKAEVFLGWFLGSDTRTGRLTDTAKIF